MMINTVNRWWIAVGLMLFAGVATCAEGEETVLIDGPEVDLLVSDMAVTLQSVPEEMRYSYTSNPEKLRSLMDSTYLTKVAYHRGVQGGLDKKEEIAAKLEVQRRNLIALAELSRFVESHTAEELDAAVDEYYLANRANYREPRKADVAHILFRLRAGDEEATLALANQVRESIAGGELSFEEAAGKHSDDDRSREHGGALPRISKDTVEMELDAAIFALEEGELSKPIRTKFGYHLVKVKKHHPEVDRDEAAVKAEIRANLVDSRGKSLTERYYLDIRDDKRVKLNEPAIRKFIEGDGG